MKFEVCLRRVLGVFFELGIFFWSLKFSYDFLTFFLNYFVEFFQFSLITISHPYALRVQQPHNRYRTNNEIAM